jgi:signal transduction histidine kinase
MMKPNLIGLSQQYLAALRTYLKEGLGASLLAVHGLRRQAAAGGLMTSDMARIHEGAMTVLLKSAAGRKQSRRQAEMFFAEALPPTTSTLPVALNASTDSLKKISKSPAKRAGLAQRKTAEEEFRKGGKHYAKLLRDSHHLQRHLRHMTHQLLFAQESERKRISRELNDEIAQTLLGINVRLLTLKQAAKGSPENLAQEIANTQRLVEDSLQSINRFARVLAQT